MVYNGLNPNFDENFKDMLCVRGFKLVEMTFEDDKKSLNAKELVGGSKDYNINIPLQS